MKNKAKQSKKIKAIKALLESRKEGLQPIPDSRKNLKKVSITVEDHEDYLMRVRALLEVSVFALEGQGSFYSKGLSHISKEATVSLILEMAIDLLPSDQMYCMNRIAEIIDKDYANYPGHTTENENIIKPQDHEKEKDTEEDH